MIDRVRAGFPAARVFATTLREVVNANQHLWGAIVASAGEVCTVAPR
ncbi:MAG TPA: hypothetical protein PLE12_03920 [Propionicimonas sp.]|jgi:2-dehydro-3-deoxygluconokinase|nr:hypothetical protein [Propionicimonas sp.]